MKDPDRLSYVNYRMEKATETLVAAQILIDNRQWNSAINRLYYACFYAVTAVLVLNGIETRSHSGAKTQFFLHFIKNKKVRADSGRLYSDLFDWRQKGDYGDFFDFSEPDVNHLIDPCRELIDQISGLIAE